ncbi:MAG: hypothetical protein ACJ797_19040, partial [Ktedonobacteraceae bacterium]
PADRFVWPGKRQRMSRGGKRSKGCCCAFSCVGLTLTSKQATCLLLLPRENASLPLLAHLALLTLAVLLRLILGGATPMQKNDLHPIHFRAIAY